jgi:3-oxoacyl-[acyl-carrier protein] reductase
MSSSLEQLSPEDVRTVGNRLNLNGNRALVTGAGSGIGRVVSFTLAAAGADVALSDRVVEDIEDVAASTRETFDVSVTTIEADVMEEEAVSAMVETAVSDLDGLDILVNVAGVSTVSPSEDISVKEWDLVQGVDLRGTFLAAREAFPHLNDGGRIVNIASIAGIYGSSTMSHYGAAKAGVKNLTRSLANEWATENIRVNAVAPGPILTPGVADWFDIEPETAYDRESVDREVGSPAEVADTVLFLSSPLSSYISGQTLVVAGPPPVQEDFSAAPK